MLQATRLRWLAPVLVLALFGASCEREEDEANDPDRDSATLRRAATNEWYNEVKRLDPSGPWSREYRQFMLRTAATERLRWSSTLPGARRTPRPNLITNTDWVSLGPSQATFLKNGSVTLNVTDSGRIRTILPSGNRLYVATAGGGVWRRENGAWTALSESLGSLSCGSLAQDPTNPNKLYLGLGDPFDGTGIGLVMSTDGGDSWSAPVFFGTSLVIPQVLVDPNNPQVVLVATDKGLYRSSDGGANWGLVTINTGQTAAPYIWSIAWTGGAKFVLSLEANHEATSGTTDGQVWTSADDGASWTRATGPTAASGVGRITVASAPSSRTTVYAMAAVPNATSATDLADFYKSTNGGATWTALNVLNKMYTNQNSESRRLNTLLNGQGWYDQLVMVDPTSANVAYFGGALLLAKTSDGGSTYTQMSNWLAQFNLPYVHADFHAGAFDAAGNLYVGTDGGVFESTDNGATFTDALNVGLVTHLLYSVGSSLNNANVVLGGMQDNGTRIRETTTTVFDEVIGGDGFGSDVNRSNANTMLGSLYYLDIRKSTNGGTTFAAATTGIAEAGSSSSAPFFTKIFQWQGTGSTGNELYTFSNFKVYKTTNYAGAWSALPAVTNTGVIRNVGVAPGNANIVGVVGSGGRVWLTKNAGTAWSLVATGDGKVPDPGSLPNSHLSMSWVEFDPTDTNIVYVASVAPDQTVSHLWKSTNFGTSWTAIDGNGLPAGVPVNLVRCDPKPDPASPSTVLYAGTHMGVYKSIDGGASWARFGVGMPLVSITDLYISPDESLVRAASYGRGFWELKPKPPANDFSISANPASVSAVQGTSTMTTINTAVTAGSAQNVALTVTGLPAGATATFNPNTVTAGGSSTLTLTAGAATTPGTYSLTVTGTGTSATHTTTVSFTVTPVPNDFSMAANPTSVSVVQGNSGTTMITTTVTSGSAQTVALGISGLPAGATGVFAPTSVTAGGSSTLTLTAGAATTPGTYTLTVTGTGTSATHTTTVSFTVTPAPNDFSISVSPGSVSVVQGAMGTATVSTAKTSGAAETIALSASGLPAGATAGFSPASVTAGGSSTLTLTAGAATPAGTYTVTITGTAASATHSTTVSFTVTVPVPNDFSISASPSMLTVLQGASDTSTISTAVISGVAQNVALSASGLPAGATALFNPMSVTAGGSATLTLTAGAATTPGTYTVTVTGTGTSATHTTTIMFTVTAPAPADDFSISAAPSTVTVIQGASGQSTVSTAVTSGAAQNVALMASGLPAGATATFNPTSVTAGGTSALTLTSSATTPPGTYTITITGTGPSATHTSTVSFVVTAQANDFSIAAGGSGVSVMQGASGTVPITTTLTSGAAQTITLSATGVPAGASPSFNPTSVTAGNGSTLTLSVGATTTPGSYTLTVTGTGTSATHSTTVMLNVLAATAADDFSVAADPSIVNAVQNGVGMTTITTALVSGNAQDVSFGAGGLPPGATATFDPQSLTVGASATLTLRAAATTPVGTYMVTVTATGTSGTHSTVLAFVVAQGPKAGGSGGCGCTVGRATPVGGTDLAGGLALVGLGLGLLRWRRRRLAR